MREETKLLKRKKAKSQHRRTTHWESPNKLMRRKREGKEETNLGL